MDSITVHRAAEHNLKHVSLELPRDQLIVFTGVSGSGKSSLAFDTIYAEAQRSYIDSIGRYASQYLKPLEKPEVESISGLSPAISIDQKSVSRSPRSTVGTVTEIADYLRVLFARIGTPHCPECGIAIQPQRIEQILQRVASFPDASKIQILSPIVRGRKGDYNALFAQLLKEGFTRAQIDGAMVLLDELPPNHRLERHKTHTISVVMDRLVLHRDPESIENTTFRLTQAIERAIKKSGGYVIIEDVSDAKKPVTYWISTLLSCPDHDIGIDELAPRLFSFNSPYGACPDCDGLGIRLNLDEQKLVPNPELSLMDGAIAPLHKLLGRSAKSYLKPVCRQLGISPEAPFSQLKPDIVEILFYGQTRHGVGLSENELGTDDDETLDASFWTSMAEHFDGVVPLLQRRYLYGSSTQRDYIEQFMSESICTSCHGARLKPMSLSVSLGEKNIQAISELTLQDAERFFRELPQQLDDRQLAIGRTALQEIQHRLRFLLDVGLGYLTLSRRMSTLSGGESQRIRLASQIGSGLSGVLYVLDEPSIGLHPKNNDRLISTLKHLRDMGNTVLVVEHDEATMRAADWLVDIGPKAGKHGGRIMACGDLDEITHASDSPTARFLRGEKSLTPPQTTRAIDGGPAIILEDVTHHNLKHITARFPLGTLTAVTGMSGSGKSTLVFDVLQRILREHFGKHRAKAEGYKAISGLEHIDKLIEIDQSPIGRTPRSNPATYTGLFDHIRKLFANSLEARINGFTPGHFSFNVGDGRCPQCKGDGYLKLAMSFLPDVYTPCERCQGKRYQDHVLKARINGASIADVLAMTVEEATSFFSDFDSIHRVLHVLNDTGLGYIQLGQPATTLSGGEAQRLKLASELCKRSTGKTLYLLDEPTIGLHWSDLEKLLVLLNRLVDAGNTVIVIEHDSDFIKMCDYVLDLGPGGGPDGGEIIAYGTPRDISKNPKSLTGEFLQF
jgi:excinuclease ABC subunit A